jgi:hypothetical protein
MHLHALSLLLYYVWDAYAVELPGHGRTMPVDKRVIIRSDRYLNVRVIININALEMKRVKV